MARSVWLWMFLGMTGLLTPSDAARSVEALDARLEEIRVREGLPSLAALVLQSGEIVNEMAVGRRRLNDPTPVTTDDLWHLGSCGKAMTATMITRLVETGQMAWEMTLSDVFGGVHADLAETTLKQLLTHTAGFRANFPLAKLIGRPTEAEQIQSLREKAVLSILGKAPKRSPGRQFLYSNVGYTAAGVMAERVSGKSFETFMKDELFTPLGMTTAGFGAPGRSDDASQPLGHRRLAGLVKRPVRPSAYADNSLIMAPAGTMHMSLRDWARFIKAHLTGDGGFLSAASLETLHEPFLDDYAFGWVRKQEIGPIQGTTILWHNGSNTMWYALAAVIPEHDTAFLFVTNDGDIKAAERAFLTAGKDLARLYLPENLITKR